MSLCSQVFTENVWELVTVPPESLPTRQNGVGNRDEAYCPRRVFAQTLKSKEASLYSARK